MNALFNRSHRCKSNNAEILHELFHLLSKYALFVFGDFAYMSTRPYASLYQPIPALAINESGAFNTRVPTDAFRISWVFL